MGPEDCRSRIVVFSKYEIKPIEVDGKLITEIKADAISRYKIVKPTKKMVTVLSKIHTKEEILSFCYEYGIPCPNFFDGSGPELTTDELFLKLRSSLDMPRYRNGFDVVIKAADIESIQASLLHYQFCLKVAAAIKNFPHYSSVEEEDAFNKAIIKSKDLTETDYNRALYSLAESIRIALGPYAVKHRLMAQAPPQPILVPYVTINSPLTYAWLELYNILIKSRPLNKCTYCNTYFSPAHGDSYFCSTQCGNTYGKRVKRNEEEIRSRISNNESIRSVAQSMNFEEKYLTHMVKIWEADINGRQI